MAMPSIDKAISLRALSFETTLEMIGLAANDDAQRDETVIASALRGHGDGARDFERAGDGDDVALVTAFPPAPPWRRRRACH